MPDRRERVNVIVAHHALRAEIRRRGEVQGGAVSKEDLARWVDSVILFTRAVRTLTALRAIREAGAAYYLNAGGTMESNTGTTAAVSSRSAITLAPEDRATQEAIAAKVRRLVTARYIEEVAWAPDAVELEALRVLHHLRADRTPEAARAHRVLVDRVRYDLRAGGITMSRHSEIIRLLHEYCQCGGLDWSDGRWHDAAWVVRELLRESQAEPGAE